MPNYIKYSTTAQTLALNSGNFYIGTGDVNKGPTPSTGYWTARTPPASGYTVYQNINTTPSIYVCDNDTDLINLTNTIAGQSYTSATECLVYYINQSDKMCLNIPYPEIVTNGLVLNLDAGFVPSYPRSGTTWSDISLSGNSGTLINGPTYSSDVGGTIVFDGTDDYCNFGDILNLGTSNCTINVWLKINSSWASGTKYFVSKARSAPQNYRYGFGFTQTRQLRGFVQGNGGADVVPNTVTTLNLNQWYMCTMVVNRSSTIDLYINGTIQTLDSTNTISQWNELNFQSINSFRVGSYTASNNTDPALVLPGDISLVQMYFKTLSSTEILQNYNATKSRFGL